MVGVGLEFERWVAWFSVAVDAQIKCCPGGTTSNEFAFKRREISEAQITKNL